jgi:ACS family D-galactonate transporter-like MFS transporter
MGQGKELKAFTPTLVLLLLAVLINYVDRGNLALAAPILKIEWSLSALQLGILFSAFFWTYMTLQFMVGWLIDRSNVNVIMALGFLVWSLSTAATGLATGFAMLLVMRLSLGVGESVMFPASSKICAQHLPEHRRGFANALIIAAIRWGSAIGTFGGGLLMAKYGWRNSFIVLGLIGLLWLPAWLRWKPGPPTIPVKIAEGTPSFAAILRQRSFWGSATGHFCGNYLLYFLISWLPYYLVHERHLSMATMGGTAGALYAIDSLSAIAAGWVADRRIRKGGSPALVRKTTMAAGFAVSALGLMACAYAGPHTYLLCLLAIGTGSGIGNSATFALAQTLAGSRAAGRWVGLQNGLANLSGIVGPPLTGFLVDLTGHFSAALAVAALLSVVGGLAWIFGVRKLEPVQWPHPPKALV